jgi:leucyl aminopeptidase
MNYSPSTSSTNTKRFRAGKGITFDTGGLNIKNCWNGSYENVIWLEVQQF